MRVYPGPQLGPDLTELTLTPLVKGDDGTLTDSTPVITLAVNTASLNNQTRAMRYTLDVQRQEINALNTANLNEVITANGASMEYDIFKVNNTNVANPLLQLCMNFDYFRGDWVEGTVAGSIATYSHVGVRGPCQSGMEGRGEQIASLQLGPADVGDGGNFTVTYS